MKGLFKETFLLHLDLFALKTREPLRVASELETSIRKYIKAEDTPLRETKEMNQSVFSLLIYFKTIYVDLKPYFHPFFCPVFQIICHFSLYLLNLFAETLEAEHTKCCDYIE